MSNPAEIFIVAGEASGDIHGASAVEQIRNMMPSARIFGVGGDNLRAAGVETVVDSRTIAVVGLTEVLRHRHEISAAFDAVYRALARRKPSLAILIDSPGFNFRIARRLVDQRVPILYYISPQVWAWHASRIGEMKKWSDRTDFKIAVVFPFEEKLYTDHEVPAEFVGHPLLDLVGDLPPAAEVKEKYRLDPARPMVAILPGSRRIEIERMLPQMLGAARLLKQRHKELQFILPVARTLDELSLRRINNDIGADVRYVGQDDRFGVIAACEAAMVTSGTATVEVGLCNTPMVITYRTNWLTYQAGKLILGKMRGLTNIGMVNILLGETVCPELIQHDATPQRLADEIGRYFDEPQYRDSVRGRLLDLRNKLERGGAAARVAAIAQQMILKGAH